MLLSRAPASTDSFRCISSMPTPRAFFGLEEPFPDDEPISDAPCRPIGTPASAPCTDRRLSFVPFSRGVFLRRRLAKSLLAKTGHVRIDP